MIYIIDNFIEKNRFKEIQNKLNSKEYVEYETPGKTFYIQEADLDFINHISLMISKKEGHEIEPIVGFFRISNNELDTDWRIHADGIMFDQKPDRAIVLYISPKESEELHGTALWEHEIYGSSLPKNVTNEERDKMLRVDANDLSKWKLNTVLGYEQNRLVSYPSNYFHSKYPNKSWESGRQIFVMFYKVK